MVEFRCLDCQEQIYPLGIKNGQTLRCPNCGARHIVPGPEQDPKDWIEACKKVQSQDAEAYAKWMPWSYRLWALLGFLFYLQFRLEKIVSSNRKAALPHFDWIEPIMPWAMFITMVAVFAWGFYAQNRCYGMPLRPSIFIRRGCGRWCVEALVILTILVAFSEFILHMLGSR